VCRSSQGFNAITHSESGHLPEALDGVNQESFVQYPSNEMRGSGGYFFATLIRKIREEGVCEGASDFSERVAVEEQKGGAAMARFEELKGLQEAQLRRADFLPFLRNRAVSF